jgi:RNA-directed DNA polymerase
LFSPERVERSENVTDGNADMDANRKSDESVVPATSANNGAADAPAESTEERDSTKRNAEQTALHRTPSRTKRKSRGLSGVREAARQDSTLRFTALLHHVNEECLTEAFFNLKKTAAVGVDAVRWQEYEQQVEARIADLHERIHRGAYRARDRPGDIHSWALNRGWIFR